MAASYPEMSDIKLFYSWGCYTDDDIRTYVEIGWITEAQFTEITGKPYATEEAPTEDETPSEGPSGATDGSAGA
ncbi:XkdX family protein [Bacillus inaquosorum]|uniref:XkdX family protein n=1 Tax=Bacillus inaquosorum TaxID=483913 RepID=UPI002283184B|nr:XkdX family protein [Bacillus inaquosorum]MCY9083724.1 XkdX family protein [Bacillus inaquosorum]